MVLCQRANVYELGVSLRVMNRWFTAYAPEALSVCNRLIQSVLSLIAQLYVSDCSLGSQSGFV